MIRKITASEYLKRFDNMNAEEKKKYHERVGAWLVSDAAKALASRTDDADARLLNVIQVSMGWNDGECRAFEEGAVLLSAAMHREDTWLPEMLYIKAAKRVIRRMIEVLDGICQDPASQKKAEDKKSDEKTTIEEGGVNTVSPVANNTDKTDAPLKDYTVPPRPKHIDQYVHLLPQKTQERASQVKDLLRELDESREKMRLLMESETASAADREAWAKKVTNLDNKVRKIYDELDAEWDKLIKQGRVIVDDLGNARVVEVPAETEDPEPQGLTPDEKKRRKNLRKWLVDTRYGNGDTRAEYVKRWKDNFKQYAALEGETAFEDEKMLAAAEHYGIDLKKLKTNPKTAK